MSNGRSSLPSCSYRQPVERPFGDKLKDLRDTASREGEGGNAADGAKYKAGWRKPAEGENACVVACEGERTFADYMLISVNIITSSSSSNWKRKKMNARTLEYQDEKKAASPGFAPQPGWSSTQGSGEEAKDVPLLLLFFESDTRIFREPVNLF
ncbi:hypothetical protein EGR_02916 [Echinococcus granulosus]|uniref:Uncharacterized protein n=1 Tax=Echinococcus granulosus TaxID=6210 RepID=W6V6W2_ECHGR|nr:hypothetical protein EGR_02916 [Echinococcus granulosus]EUB62164.1 hypothetical protein EGR_02916 [Echinococcus granulosus]